MAAAAHGARALAARASTFVSVGATLFGIAAMTGAVRTTIVPFWVSGDGFRRCVCVCWVGGKNGIVGSLQDGWRGCVCVVLCCALVCCARLVSLCRVDDAWSLYDIRALQKKPGGVKIIL